MEPGGGDRPPPPHCRCCDLQLFPCLAEPVADSCLPQDVLIPTDLLFEFPITGLDCFPVGGEGEMAPWLTAAFTLVGYPRIRLTIKSRDITEKVMFHKFEPVRKLLAFVQQSAYDDVIVSGWSATGCNETPLASSQGSQGRGISQQF